MVSKIEPDRYANTGFSIADTPAELNERLFKAMMAKSGEERLEIGLAMNESARQLVWTGISRELSPLERKKAFLEKFYGSELALSLFNQTATDDSES